ncbi:MAG: phosphoribosyl-ATP diphosphatase, partial [Calditrichaeota bacterium]|nr:phosphoribosyl-ATP diphosphatase [Calditrichota bacterium]
MQFAIALYTRRIQLGEAFIESLNWREELLPVVTRDEDGQVLMLAYVSRESLQRTFETGRMTYYSRSRRALWTKGESSG